MRSASEEDLAQQLGFSNPMVMYEELADEGSPVCPGCGGLYPDEEHDCKRKTAQEQVGSRKARRGGGEAEELPPAADAKELFRGAIDRLKNDLTQITYLEEVLQDGRFLPTLYYPEGLHSKVYVREEVSAERWEELCAVPERRLFRLARQQRRDGIHDYDRHTGAKGSNRRFVRKPDPAEPNAPGTISYPFDPEIGPDLDFLMEEARRQGNYRSSASDITDADFPAASDDRTVFFVDAGGVTDFLEYFVDRTPQARGTIVVRDGNLTISDSSGGFSGVIIVTGDGVDTGSYDGGRSVEGFVVASGDMTIRGSASPSTVSLTTRPGFYEVRLWSWRELYQ